MAVETLISPGVLARENDQSFVTSGPVSVEHKWKKGFEGPDTKKKTLGDLVNETKPKKKSQRPKS